MRSFVIPAAALIAISIALGAQPAAQTVPAAQAAPPSEQCREAQKGLVYYRGAYNKWRAKAEKPRQTEWARAANCDGTRYLARVARSKARAAKKAYKAWRAYHWDWRAWLPANWLAVGICESGHNPPNWNHDSGTYVSAFGIYRPGYRDDAHRIGNLSWDETKAKLGRVPTPREQYEAALSHYRTHGDGWGCPGP